MEEPQQPFKQFGDFLTVPGDPAHSKLKETRGFLTKLPGNEKSGPVRSYSDGGVQQKIEPLRQVKSCSNLHTSDRVIPETWSKLSDEERAKLEIDIFKPLDFFEIFFNRMKQSYRGEIITSLSELDI